MQAGAKGVEQIRFQPGFIDLFIHPELLTKPPREDENLATFWFDVDMNAAIPPKCVRAYDMEQVL